MKSEQLPLKNRLPVLLKAAETDNEVPTEVLNLSEDGIYVDTPSVFPVGSDVVCEFNVNDKSMSIPGHVIWTHRSLEKERKEKLTYSDRTSTQPLIKLGDEHKRILRSVSGLPGGMGIVFDSISETDLCSVRTLSESIEAESYLVRIWFPGLDEAIYTRGIPTHKGLVLSTNLPFLQIGSSVSFSLAEDSELYHGELGQIELNICPEHTSPRLSIEIKMVSNRESTRRFHIHQTQYGRLQRKVEIKKQAFHSAIKRDNTNAKNKKAEKLLWKSIQIHSPFTGIFLWLFLLVAVLASSVSSMATYYLMDKKPRVTESYHQNIDRNLNDKNKEAKEKKRKIEAEQANRDISDELDTKKTKHNRNQKKTSIQSSISNTIRTDGTKENYDRPKIIKEEDETKVIVPLIGKGKKTRQYLLSTPGISFTIMGAKPVIPFGIYKISKGLVRRIWIRPYGSGTQVRVIFRRRSVHAKAAYSDNKTVFTLIP